MAKIAVASQENYVEQASALAKQLKLPLADMNDPHYEFFLVITENHLALHQIGKRLTPLYVDFLSKQSTFRRKKGGGKQQLIAKAVGIKSKEKLTVLDVTAGLGKDAFVLACLGCHVQMIERSPIISELLQDGLRRAQTDPFFKTLHLKLTLGDAIVIMQDLNKKNVPDVVYLDPMFPVRTKSALVKKEMRMLKAVVGEDEDAKALLENALKVAKKRVVVKRPRYAPSIEGPKPTLVFKGKSSRFDVYFPSHARL